VADGQQASGGVEAEVGPIEPAAHARDELGNYTEAKASFSSSRLRLSDMSDNRKYLQ
jgi:hypothetical protein